MRITQSTQLAHRINASTLQTTPHAKSKNGKHHNRIAQTNKKPTIRSDGVSSGNSAATPTSAFKAAASFAKLATLASRIAFAPD